MSSAATALGLAAAPEVTLPALAVKHAPAIMMFPLIIVSIILLIVGTIVYATEKTTKVPGTALIVFGLLLGGGAFYVMSSSEKKN